MSENERTCGFDPNNVDDQWWERSPDSLESDDDLNIPCDRPEWEDTGRCVLHAQRQKTVEDLNNTIEIGEKLDFAYIPGITLSELDIDFSGMIARFAEFSKVDFTGTSINGADLRYSNLQYSELGGMSMDRVNFSGANMQEATLERTECRNVDFSESTLKQALLSQIRLRSGVILDGADFTEVELTGAVAAESVLEDYESKLERGQNWHAASKEYRKWAAVADNSSLPDSYSRFYRKYKHSRRKSYDFFSIKRLFAGASRGFILYGESPYRTLLWMGAIITIATPAYSLTEGIRSGGETINLTCSNLPQYLYFSIAAFFSLPYANYSPVGFGAKLIAISESIFGALLIALIVFVLGRRATL
ncbi:pentapeptide repeat-containing protein [Haloarcula sp. CGMCC 1.2071]|uniref:pentapeptide repeat-containing protein n=1 Tax=Haloarcula sp. CGMCC 1.2071 TaxID=3111454 RepID=UPI00300E936E